VGKISVPLPEVFGVGGVKTCKRATVSRREFDLNTLASEPALSLAFGVID